jgi:hypothetical protein
MAISSWLGRGECRKGEENEENEREKERKKREGERACQKRSFLVVAIFVEERKELPLTRSCEPYLHLSSHSSDI